MILRCVLCEKITASADNAHHPQPEPRQEPPPHAESPPESAPKAKREEQHRSHQPRPEPQQQPEPEKHQKSESQAEPVSQSEQQQKLKSDPEPQSEPQAELQPERAPHSESKPVDPETTIEQPLPTTPERTDSILNVHHHQCIRFAAHQGCPSCEHSW